MSGPTLEGARIFRAAIGLIGITLLLIVPLFTSF